MKRTTIFIPEVLEADLQQYARRTKKPVAWVVREAVSAYLSAHARPSALPASIGMGASGQRDLSERIEQLAFADLAGRRREATASKPATRKLSRHK